MWKTQCRYCKGRGCPICWPKSGDILRKRGWVRMVTRTSPNDGLFGVFVDYRVRRTNERFYRRTVRSAWYSDLVKWAANAVVVKAANRG
jgi:hypothetical protein